MTTYETQRIRILQNVVKWYEAGQDVFTSASPRFANGSAVQFEFAFSFSELEDDSQLLDVSQFSSITLDLKRLNTRTGLPVMSKTVALADLNTSLDKADWDGGNDQHVAFEFTHEESDIFLERNEETLWLVVSAVTAGGAIVTLGAWTIAVIEDGAGVAATAGVVAPTYYTAAQSDARFLLATDLSDKLSRDGSLAMTGNLTLANSTPSNSLHAASKGYVDGLLADYLPLAGGTLTGMLTLPSTTPTDANHATRKGYVDAQIAAVTTGYVPTTGTTSVGGLKTFTSLLTASAGISVAGGVTLTSGALTLFAAPSSSMHAATKTYVDSGDAAVAAAAVPNTGTSSIAGNKTFGDAVTVSGGLTVSSGITMLTGSLTLTGLSGVLKASTGVVAGSATTTDLTEGSNLYFTDARARAALLTGLSTGSGGTITSADSILVAFGRTENRLAALESGKLALAGGTMTGPLVFSGASNYGIRLANFAASALPASPVAGALIYDTTNAYLRFWTGSTWKVLNEGGGGGAVNWYDGTFDPDGGTGSDGNYYVETQDDDDEGTIWKKTGGTWSVIVAPSIKKRGGAVEGTLTFQSGLAPAIRLNGPSTIDILHDGSGSFIIELGGNTVLEIDNFWNLKLLAEVHIGGNRVLTSQQAAISDISGVTTDNDVEARAAVGSILTALRAHGLIAT